ncbi:MAG: hypothetical protein NXI10_13265 [bacterium]|nr:hypothetical protein [bacterium]
MKNIVQSILFALSYIPLTGYAQLDSLEGYWLNVEQPDTIILKIEGFRSKRRKNDLVRKGLLRSTNRQLEGVYYYTIDNDSLSIIDAYGNVECKSLSFNINSENLDIYEGCDIHYSRITKEQYNKLSELIKSGRLKQSGSEEINRVDY